jgi:hypothetical protein
MNRFVVVYEFNGEKSWTTVSAQDALDAEDQVIQSFNGNNILILSASFEDVERLSEEIQEEEDDNDET